MLSFADDNDETSGIPVQTSDGETKRIIDGDSNDMTCITSTDSSKNGKSYAVNDLFWLDINLFCNSLDTDDHIGGNDISSNAIGITAGKQCRSNDKDESEAICPNANDAQQKCKAISTCVC